MKIRYALAFILGLSGAFLKAQIAQAMPMDQCRDLLSEASPLEQRDGTDRLIAYFEQLIEHQVIGSSELRRFLSALEKGSLENMIREDQARLSSAHLIHQKEIYKYLKNAKLNTEQLSEWAQRALQRIESVRLNRETVRADTRDSHQKIEFFPVSLKHHNAGFLRSFAMMSTPVTQKQWIEVMGENPSRFIDGDRTVTLTLQGKAIQMQPDHPVENITWWSAIVYANRVSESLGLPLVYDWSLIEFLDLSLPEDQRQVLETPDAIFGAAARGVLGSRDPQASPKINALGGDIEQAEGIRLPTGIEQAHMLRERDRAFKADDLEGSNGSLKNHAWYRENSLGSTHAVGELLPLVLEGAKFYDLYGNVREWGQSWYGRYETIGGREVEPQSGPGRVAGGGSWDSDVRDLKSDFRYFVVPNSRYEFLGFRLVRKN